MNVTRLESILKQLQFLTSFQFTLIFPID